MSERCAYVYSDLEKVCNRLKADHERHLYPLGVTWSHAFVPPPTCAGAVADEAEMIARIVLDRLDMWGDGDDGRVNIGRAHDGLDAVAREAFAAGRLAGLRDMRERAEAVARGAQSANKTLPGALLAMLTK